MINIEVVEQKSASPSVVPICERWWFALEDEPLHASIRLDHFIESLANAKAAGWRNMALKLQQALTLQRLFVWHKPAKLDQRLINDDRLILTLPCRIDPKTMRRMLAAKKPPHPSLRA